MDLNLLLNALLKKKWVVILCSLAALLGSLLFVLNKQDLYQSAAQYSTGFTMKQKVSLKDDDVYNFMEVEQRFKNVIETFKSPVVVGMLSYELMLHDLKDKRPFRTLTPAQKEKINLTENQLDSIRQKLEIKLAKQELLVAYDPNESKAFELIKAYQYNNDQLLKTLIVDRIQGTDYLNILFKSENPELSAFVVNTIGKKFYNFFTRINAERTGASIEKLDSLTLSKKNEYDMSVNALQKFREQVGSPNVGDRAKGAMDMLKTLTEQQNNNEARLNQLRGQLLSVKAQIYGIESTATPSSTNVNGEITSLLQTNRELAKQLAAKGGKDPEIQNQIDANVRKIQMLNPEMKGSGKADLAKKKEELIRQKTDIEYDIASLQGTIGSVQQKINLYSGLSNQGGGDEVTLQRLQNEVDRLNSEYQNLISKSNSAQDVNVAPDINFKQTLVGQPAINPEPGNRKMIIALSTIAAFLISAFSILIVEFLDNSMRAPSIFQRQVRIPLLATLTKLPSKRLPMQEMLKIQEKGSETDPETLTFIENIRKLRYELECQDKRFVLITSTQPAQGKSIVTEALAASLTLASKQVLIIDCNFFNNSLTRTFDAKPTLPLFQWSSDEADNQRRFQSVISKTAIPQCDIIGCEETSYSPMEILPKQHLFSYLSTVKTKYDYVLVEGADINHHADSKELSNFVDGILVVYSAKSKLTQLDKDSIQFLKSQSKKIVGATLNQVELENLEL
jgi:polysaccharide biosynthesis transport protein